MEADGGSNKEEEKETWLAAMQFPTTKSPLKRQLLRIQPAYLMQRSSGSRSTSPPQCQRRPATPGPCCSRP
eukprot:scaffold99403_cov19-Tisochrysis_lutea.AAC.4